ncbi:MAG: YicC/YloC family endoribonuclease [Bacteroidales bacterium]
MIKSMTGYGKSTCRLNNSNFIIEIKTLNSKSFDLYVKLPQIIRSKETQIRNILSDRIVRGKVELIVSIETLGNATNFTINKELFKEYYKNIKNISVELDYTLGDNIIATILKLPDVLVSQTTEISKEDWLVFEQSLGEALMQLNEFRSSEGGHLGAGLIDNIENISALLNKIGPFESERIEIIREKITKSLNNIIEKGQVDENRLEQELIYYLEKLDINEEKVRLEKHLQYFIETMKKEDNAGKKLGFISQEIGREVNTLGSKAQHAELQKIVIQMKDELEKIKEQLMNVL